MFERDRLNEALETLGALLAERGEHVGVLVVGGGSLLLLGVVERPTADVDIVGFASSAGYTKADVLPGFLTTAVREVGDALGLGGAWFNGGPAGLIDFGLPAGLENRVTVRCAPTAVSRSTSQLVKTSSVSSSTPLSTRASAASTSPTSALSRRRPSSCSTLHDGHARMTPHRGSWSSCIASSTCLGSRCPMPASRQRRPAATFAGQALALASGAWTELGVSGWTSTHGNWAIDPEPLLLFTAWLGDADPRLRDEATDWCVRNWRHLSKARLKNLLRHQPDEVKEAFGEFAATVGTHAGITWPGATEPRRFVVTGRSTLPALDHPSLVWLRLRFMFGVGARAEILRCFLSKSEGLMSVSALASATGYTKRNVAEECDTFERAGVLSMRAQGNRFYYALARRSELEAFVGEAANNRPSWTAMLNIARELVSVERRGDAQVPTLAVHARSVLRSIKDDLDELSIEPLSETVQGVDLWPGVWKLGHKYLGSWSIGQFAPL